MSSCHQPRLWRANRPLPPCGGGQCHDCRYHRNRHCCVSLEEACWTTTQSIDLWPDQLWRACSDQQLRASPPQYVDRVSADVHRCLCADAVARQKAWGLSNPGLGASSSIDDQTALQITTNRLESPPSGSSRAAFSRWDHGHLPIRATPPPGQRGGVLRLIDLPQDCARRSSSDRCQVVPRWFGRHRSGLPGC